MREWFRNYFSTDNDVNEDIVMSSLFFLAMLPAGFIPAVPAYVFYTLFSGCLIFAGKKVTNDLIKK